MERKPRKSLVQSLHDRSSGKSGKSKKIQYNNREAHYLPNDSIDDIMQRVSRLENECVRCSTIVTMNLERIRNLEKNMEKLSDQIEKLTRLPPPSQSQSRSNTLERNPTDSPKLSRWIRITKFFTNRPTLDTLRRKNIYKNEPCFDTEIETVIKHERYRTIPKIVVECVELIESRVKIEQCQGAYRTSGDYAKIQKIRFNIDANDYECLQKVNNVHTIIGVLKLFLREIKAPLIRTSEIKAFVGSPREWTLASINFKLDALQKLMKTLPEINRDTLYFLMKHLCRLTRMPLQYTTTQSLAISLTPTIFHITLDYKCDISATLKESSTLANCLEIMIEYCDRIFETSHKRIYKKLSRWVSCPGSLNFVAS